MSQSQTLCMCPEALSSSSDFRQWYLTTCGIQKMAMCAKNSVCVSTIRHGMCCHILVEHQGASLKVRPFLPVTSSNNILQTSGIHSLAMHTNDSECVSTIGYVVIYFRGASGLRPQHFKVRNFVCVLFQWLPGTKYYKHMGFRAWQCVQTIQRVYLS